MKYLYIGLAVAALIALGYFGFFYKPCEEPEDLRIAIASMSCAMELLNKPQEQLHQELCEMVDKPVGCDFTEDEKVRILEIIDQKVIACTEKLLAAENYCVGKVADKIKQGR